VQRISYHILKSTVYSIRANFCSNLNRPRRNSHIKFFDEYPVAVRTRMQQSQSLSISHPMIKSNSWNWSRVRDSHVCPVEQYVNRRSRVIVHLQIGAQGCKSAIGVVIHFIQPKLADSCCSLSSVIQYPTMTLIFFCNCRGLFYRVKIISKSDILKNNLLLQITDFWALEAAQFVGYCWLFIFIYGLINIV
jgi:hypothetical protein